MKKIIRSIFLATLVGITSLFGAGCFDGGGDLLYNEYPTDYDPNVNSWEQIAEDDEDVDITWFTDYNYTLNQSTVDLIYRKTGVRVNFVSASDDKHTELNKWITDNSLPDVVALGDEATIAQLSEEGYVYKINRLAESYAPSLLPRLTQDMRDYYNLHVHSAPGFSEEEVAHRSGIPDTALCVSIASDTLHRFA